jgi:hypothetical protein
MSVNGMYVIFASICLDTPFIKSFRAAFAVALFKFRKGAIRLGIFSFLFVCVRGYIIETIVPQ